MLLSKIFGRKKSQPAPSSNDALDIRALMPLMRAAAPPSSDPKDLAANWPMEHVLKVFPFAQRALFQKYHIGGCSSCGFQPTDSLETVARNHQLEPQDVIAFIHTSADMERGMEIEVAETAALLKQNGARLLDVRTTGEYAIARIEGSVLVDQTLMQEIMASWPKETEIVVVCHHGVRSLDATAYLRGHGFHNARSMRGGIDAWSVIVDPTVPRY